MTTDTLRVHLVYASGPGQAWTQTLDLPPGSTLAQAVSASGFAQRFPGYDLACLQAGIYGQRCEPERELADGDRVEIYRPLVFDPMESRRRRAQHRQKRLSRT
jgi:putative ubiquitin-RnfH superfamily antitoxin RatB of RatAB toxin-antitoxin module